MVIHKHSIPDFMKHLNPMMHSNLSAKSNAKHHMPTSPIPPFLSSLNSLVDSNVFDNALGHKYNNKANVILRKKQTKVELAQYFHATCLSPHPRTLLKASKNNHFASWPGLTSDLISKHLPKSIAALQGHMVSER